MQRSFHERVFLNTENFYFNIFLQNKSLISELLPDIAPSARPSVQESSFRYYRA